MDETKIVLDNLPALLQQLPSSYKKLSPSPLLVGKPTNLNQSLVKATHSESKSYESIPDQSQQVEMIVDPVLPSENNTIREENENDIVQILFVTSDSNELGGNPPIPS